MTSPSLELQGALYTALTQDAALSALVNGRVYDAVPQNVEFPYVELGPETVVPFRPEGIAAGQHDIQIDCWARGQGMAGVKAITAAVKAVLESGAVTLSVNAVSNLFVRSIRHVDDPDGSTTHGIVSISLYAEETA